jgi:hypothetical protein
VHPAQVHVEASIEDRNRLTSAFRIVLAIPHFLLVGGPIAATLTWSWSTEADMRYEWGAGGGVLGAVAAVVALIAWSRSSSPGATPKASATSPRSTCAGVCARSALTRLAGARHPLPRAGEGNRKTTRLR